MAEKPQNICCRNHWAWLVLRQRIRRRPDHPNAWNFKPAQSKGARRRSVNAYREELRQARRKYG